MKPDSAPLLRASLTGLDPKAAHFASDAVEHILAAARAVGASDVHIQPGPEVVSVHWRVDGVLHPVVSLPIEIAPNVVARLKVLADLLTYRSEVPQEGRIRSSTGDVEMRVSTFPTLHGEKAVVRIFAEAGRHRALNELGLPPELVVTLSRLLLETSGMVLVTGPAGGGKTTTLYACLRELASATGGARSLTSLEDPIESALPGVAQSQVNPSAGFTLATGLRSLLRQDPEVIAVGEIRDRETAESAFGASLTGHLVLSTFHAGSASEAVGRLADMGIEPYILRSGLLAVINQRLARRLCPDCSRPAPEPVRRLGIDVSTARTAVGCEACGNTGHRGRIVLAEILVPGRDEVGRAILDRDDVASIERRAVAAGMTTRWDCGRQAVEAGLVSPIEVRRVLGFSEPGMSR